MRRSAFTMLELLVVMVLMSILIALVATVYAQSIGAARVAATRTTIRQVQRAVQYRVERFREYNHRNLATLMRAQYDTAGNPSPYDKIPLELAGILVQKNRFRATFPQRLEDLFGIDGVPGTEDDSDLWRVWKARCNGSGLPVSDADIRPVGHALELENAELLYLFLDSGERYGDNTFQVDNLNHEHVQDANGNGLPELVDSWGQPIRFYNWPTRLVRPGGGTNPIEQSTFAVTARQMLAITPPPASPSPFPANEYSHPLNMDPDDPYGTLSSSVSAGWFTAPFQLNRNPFGSLPNLVTCQPFDETNYHTLDTYHTILIVSAGPDEQLGLVEPTDADLPRRNADLESLDDALDNLSILP